MTVAKRDLNVFFDHYYSEKVKKRQANESTTWGTWDNGNLNGMGIAIYMLKLDYLYKEWLYKNDHYTLSSDDIGHFCIVYDLYTMGTTEEYTALLNAIDDNCITVKDIAQDIYDHSRYLDGQTPKDLEKMIIYNVIKEV